METSAFQSLKTLIVQTLHLSKDALHVYVGLLVLLAAALAFRKRIGTLAPLAAAVFAACVGELLDMHDDLQSLGHWRWKASLHDMVNTVFWPTVLTLLARTRLWHPRD